MMTSFDWDDSNVDHLARHRVEPDEAEQSLGDPNVVVVAARRRSTERRWEAIGATESGRILLVVFTRRLGSIRVITAHDATGAEKTRYYRRRRRLMSNTKQRELNIVHNLDDIPDFPDEDAEDEFWSTHSLGPEILDQMQPPTAAMRKWLPQPRPHAASRTKRETTSA